MLLAKYLPLAATRVIGRTSLKLQKYAPEILTGVGILGTAISGALLVRAGMKTAPILEEHREVVSEIRSFDLPEKEIQKDVTYQYIKTAKKFVVLYGPAVTLGAASIISIIGGHGILKKRNIAMAAAYKALESSYSEYRKRVREEFGEDKELDIHKGVREVTEIDENGKKKKVIQKNEFGHSPYAKCFDEFSRNWDPTPEYNLMFLRSQQAYFNQRLNAYGHVFLNEVYDALDIPRVTEGQIVGWLREGEKSDGYIDFGLYDLNSESARRFVNGYERAIWLDFNVDGPIFEDI